MPGICAANAHRPAHQPGKSMFKPLQRAGLSTCRVTRLTIQNRPPLTNFRPSMHVSDDLKHIQVKSFTSPGPPVPNLEPPEPVHHASPARSEVICQRSDQQMYLQCRVQCTIMIHCNTAQLTVRPRMLLSLALSLCMWACRLGGYGGSC